MDRLRDFDFCFGTTSASTPSALIARKIDIYFVRIWCLEGPDRAFGEITAH
jgi:hypothetical protein